MKISLDLAIAAVVGLLLFLNIILFSVTKNLQTQIDELKIIVDQKFLPALILDKEKLLPR